MRYFAREDSPQFVDTTEDWDADSSALLTGSIDAIDSIDSHGVTWRSVVLFVEVPDEDARGDLRAQLERDGWIVSERVDVLRLAQAATSVEDGDITHDRNGAVRVLTDGVRALGGPHHAGQLRSWAWDLEFDG